MSLELPLYFSVNDRPVKVIATPDGGIDVFKLDLWTGEFVRDHSQLSTYVSGSPNVDKLTFEKFEELVRWHLDNIGRKT